MIFITGGISQGKRTYAANVLSMTELTDGAEVSFEEALSAECIYDYQILVRRLMNGGTDPAAFTEQLCKEGKVSAVIMTEIGCGIVPIDKEERLRREAAGRCGCILAAHADTVVRMFCGIPTVIKGEPT